MVDYGITRKLELSYEDAVEKITAALKEEGFGILTEIDVKAVLKKKIDVDFRKYVILGACNPTYSNKALNAEIMIGLLLPCNVIVFENDGGGSTVSVMDPGIMTKLIDNPELGEVAKEVREKLERALNSI
ncbi:MAG: DUF302 domain-containing protein [Deltaproteobacteria bacterium]|nr:DUF302 domain-containing protein [Deltaproteobacteria bacterium]